MWLLYVLAAMVLVAGLSAGSALGLHLLKPEWSERKRTLVAAAIAGFMPMSIAFGGFFSEPPSGDDFALGLGALILTQLLVLTILALPPAFWATSKLGKGRDSDLALPEGEEPHLIEG